MICTKDEIRAALQDAIEEAGDARIVAVPVLFLKDVYEALTEEDEK